MRIFRRNEFLKLPVGTLYYKGAPWYFGNLSVKGETLNINEFNDFYFMEIGWIDAPDNDEHIWLEKMVEEKLSLPIGDTYGRDGMFEDDDLFMVLEQNDLLHVRMLVDRALGLAVIKREG